MPTWEPSNIEWIRALMRAETVEGQLPKRVVF